MKKVLILGFVGAAVGTILLLVVGFPLNHDVAWFMSMSRRVLGGERLYSDIVDINPPLVVYLLMPPVLLSDAAGLSDSVSLKLSVLGVTTCAIAWHLRLMGARRGGTRTAWWIFLMCFGLFAVPASDFGQREHLMLLLTLPFLALKWRRTCHLETGTVESALAGGLAGLGFAIKPYFVLIWLALEAHGWFTRRRDEPHVRPETLAVASTLALYLVFVVAAHPAYLELMTEIAPLYSRFSSDGFRLLFVVYSAIPLFVVALATTLANMEPRNRNFATVCLVFAAAGFLAALIQGKGWRYHSLPMIVATVFVWGTVFDCGVTAVMGQIELPARLRGGFILGILLLALYPFSLGMAHAFTLARDSRTTSLQQSRTVARYNPDSILILGDVVGHAFPLVNILDVRSVSPFPSMWWLRVFYGTGEVPTRAPARDDRTSTERRLSDMLVTDFVETPPDLVLVDTTKHKRFGGEAFPYVDYFGSDSAFAQVWKRYERVGAMDKFAIWQASESEDAEDRGLQRSP